MTKIQSGKPHDDCNVPDGRSIPEKPRMTSNTYENSLLWRWLRCGSLQEEVFWRSRLSTAFRTGWACLMVGIILQVGSMHVRWVTFPVFGYVMAVTVVGESTAGKAMQDAFAIVSGTAQGIGISLVVLQLFPPASCFQNIGAAIPCIALTSFFVGLPKKTPTTNILHKRIMLAHCAIIYLTAVVHHDNMDPVLFPLQLAGTTIVGATCGALALILPCPRFAISEIHSHLKLAARIGSERLRVLTDAFCAGNVVGAAALNLQAKALSKIASSVHSEISTIEDGMGWEIKRLPYTSHKLQYVTQGLNSVRRNLVGMELALQAELTSSARISKQRQLIGRTMKDSLVYVADWVTLALKHASTDMTKQSHSSHALITEEGKEVLSSFDEALSYTNHLGGYVFATEDLQLNNKNAEKRYPDDDIHDAQMSGIHLNRDEADHDSNFSCSDSEMVETTCNASKQQLEHRVAARDIVGEDGSSMLGDNSRTSGGVATNNGSLNDRIVDHMRNVTLHNQYMGSSLLTSTMGALLSFGDQAAASFFLFNIKKFVQSTRRLLASSDGKGALSKALEHSNLPKTKVTEAATDAPSGQVQTASLVRILVSNCDGGLNPSPAACQKIPGASETCFAQKDLNSRLAKNQWVCDKCAANSNPPANKRPKHPTHIKNMNLDQIQAAAEFFRPTSEQLRAAFKLSLAMALGGFFGFWFNNKKGYWADITLALGYTGLAKGGSFKVAVLRTLGTVSGSIYGLLVILATFNFPAVRLVSLIPWVVFTSFLRQSKIFGYSGAVSAFTGAIVILARTNKDTSDEEFTVIRIVEAAMGMASFIIVEVLVMPRRAASMVKPEIISGFSKFQDFMTTIFQAYSNGHCCVCNGVKTIEELRNKEAKVRKAINCQSALVKEAAEEPQFWFSPFPEKQFAKIMEEQKNVLEMLHFSVTIFEEIKQAAKEAQIPTEKLLQASLRSAIKLTENNVVPTIAVLANALAMKAEQMSAKQKLSLSTFTGKGKHSSEMGCRFMKLERVVISESMTQNNANSKQYQCVDTAEAEARLIMEAFEKGVLQVAYELAILKANMLTLPVSSTSQNTVCSSLADCPLEGFDIFCNSLFLALGTLAFATNRLVHHVGQLEKMVHELLQEENPWTLVQMSDISEPKTSNPRQHHSPSSCSCKPSSLPI